MPDLETIPPIEDLNLYYKMLEMMDVDTNDTDEIEEE